MVARHLVGNLKEFGERAAALREACDDSCSTALDGVCTEGLDDGCPTGTDETDCSAVVDDYAAVCKGILELATGR